MSENQRCIVCRDVVDSGDLCGGRDAYGRGSDAYHKQCKSCAMCDSTCMRKRIGIQMYNCQGTRCEMVPWSCICVPHLDTTKLTSELQRIFLLSDYSVLAGEICGVLLRWEEWFDFDSLLVVPEVLSRLPKFFAEIFESLSKDGQLTDAQRQKLTHDYRASEAYRGETEIVPVPRDFGKEVMLKPAKVD